MEVQLYQYSGRPNVIDKALGTKVSITGSLSQGTDIFNPIITFSDLRTPPSGADGYDKLGTDTWIDLTQYNYMYIPLFRRYYFITDISVTSSGIWQVSAAVDVLKSFASAIKNWDVVAARSTSDGDYYLTDETIVSDLDSLVQVYDPESGFTQMYSDVSYGTGYVATIVAQSSDHTDDEEDTYIVNSDWSRLDASPEPSNYWQMRGLLYYWNGNTYINLIDRAWSEVYKSTLYSKLGHIPSPPAY